MSRNPYDPQTAPDTWERIIGPVMTDVWGDEYVLVINDDGEKYIIDITENPY